MQTWYFCCKYYFLIQISNIQKFEGLEKDRDSDPVYNLLLSQGGVLGKAVAVGCFRNAFFCKVGPYHL